MRELEKKFTKKGCTYVQIYNENDVYIYAVHNDKYNELHIPSYYEVFFRKTKKEAVMPDGTVIPERVVYPRDEDFGNWAWCCGDLKSLECVLKEKMQNQGIRFDKLEGFDKKWYTDTPEKK